MIPWLRASDAFPPVESACDDPNGLLCAGADLSPTRLIEAYRQGIFPWFSPDDPLLWWSPDPRTILVPAELRIARALHRTLVHGDYEIRVDSDFPAVIRACATTPRPGQRGTWISDDMQLAYTALFAQGYAHTVETWRNGELVGGLYGIALGKMFYGESMFSRVSDASKIALAHLCRFLDRQGFALIDCQMYTTHLASLGAREIPRHEFLTRLRPLVAAPQDTPWKPDALAGDWQPK